MASTSGVCLIDSGSLGVSSLYTSTSRCSELSSRSSLPSVKFFQPSRSLPQRCKSLVVQNTAAEGSQTQTASTTPASKKPSVTIEYQRQKAKELVKYFEEKKLEEQIRKERIFGWTRKNEIGNGRWVMFGIAVGLLTEYATGSNFIDQLKIIVSNLGILDLE